MLGMRADIETETGLIRHSLYMVDLKSTLIPNIWYI